MKYAILFDIGNVIVDFDFQISVRKIAPQCALSPEDIFRSVSELKDDLESGSISTEEFLDLAIEKIGYSGDRKFLIDSFQDVFELNEKMVELILAEKSDNTPLYLLSNTNGLHVPFLFDNYPVFSAFDRAIYSHEVRCMKPDPEIYRKTIERLDIDPKRTIYIDDLPENIAMGRSFGFHSIPYSKANHTEFLRAFETIRSSLV